MKAGRVIRQRCAFCTGIAVAVALLASVAAGATPPEVRRESRRLLAQARAQLVHGDTSAALASLDSVLAVADADPDAPFVLGSIRLAQGDTAAAAAVLEEATALAPMSCRLKLLLAWIHFAQGRTEPAAALVQEALMLRATDPDGLYLQGRLALAAADSAAALAVWERLLVDRIVGEGR